MGLLAPGHPLHPQTPWGADTCHLDCGTSLLTGHRTLYPERIFHTGELPPHSLAFSSSSRTSHWTVGPPHISLLLPLLDRPWHLILTLLQKLPASRPLFTPHPARSFQNHLPSFFLWLLTAHHPHHMHTPARLSLGPLDAPCPLDVWPPDGLPPHLANFHAALDTSTATNRPPGKRGRL